MNEFEAKTAGKKLPLFNLRDLKDSSNCHLKDRVYGGKMIVGSGRCGRGPGYCSMFRITHLDGSGGERGYTLVTVPLMRLAS